MTVYTEAVRMAKSRPRKNQSERSDLLCHIIIHHISAKRVRVSGITKGAFHSTKLSENSGSKSNGTENFGKLISKISVSLSRLSFFLEIWKYRKFSVPFDISTRYESAPVSQIVPESYKMTAGRYYTGCKAICHSSNLLLIEYPPQKYPGPRDFS